MPLVKRTLAILRKAEFGFLGVVVVTFKQTPRLKGEGYAEGLFFNKSKPRHSAGDFGFALVIFLGLFISWWMVGMK